MVVYTIIPALSRLSQEDQKFQASLGYIVRPCLKQNKAERQFTHSLFLMPCLLFYTLKQHGFSRTDVCPPCQGQSGPYSTDVKT
jgi:hypothetical protein